MRGTILKSFSFEEQGHPVTFTNVPVDKCSRCGESFITPATNRLLDALAAAYHHRGTINFPSPEPMTPSAVQGIRKRFHSTQTSFASLLGVTPTTIALWEQGRRQPTGTARVLMRLLDDLKSASAS